MKNILHGEHFGVVRHATRTLLQRRFPSYQYYAAPSVDALLELLTLRPYNIIILGDFPRQSELIPTIRKIRMIAANTRILIFTAAPERIYATHCLLKGASGFVSKRSSLRQVIEAVRTVLSKNRYISDRMRSHLLEYTVPGNFPARNPLMAMSVREMIVIDMLCEGYWIKEIAGLLQLETSTVSTYKKRIYEKLRVHTLLEMYRKVQELKDQELLSA